MNRRDCLKKLGLGLLALPGFEKTRRLVRRVEG